MAKVTQYNRTVKLDDNRFWYGHCIGDIPNGIGTIYDGRPGLTLTKKSVLYHGEMKDGKYHGNGTFTSRDKTLRYSGQYKDNNYHGEGVLHFLNEDGLAFSYSGSFKDGKKNGEGTLKFLVSYEEGVDEKVIYAGEWKDDERHGKGILYIYNDEGDRLAKAEGNWKNCDLEFNIFEGKITDSRSSQLIMDGCAEVPLLGNGIDYKFHWGTEYNNKFTFKDYYNNNELIVCNFEVPFKKCTKTYNKNNPNIIDFIFELVIKINKGEKEEEEYNANTHFRFENKVKENKEELHLIMNHLEIPEKKLGYIYQYYKTSDGYLGTFCYQMGNTFESGKFDNIEHHYELVVTMSKPMSLLDFDRNKLSNYKYNFHSYNASYFENVSYQPNMLFHSFEHNPIRDINCFLNRTAYFFGNLNKTVTYTNGRISSIFYPCMNLKVNHVHYEGHRILKEFVFDDRTVIIDTKYPNNKIIETKNNTLLEMNFDKDNKKCKHIFSKSKNNYLKALSEYAKKLVYPDIKHLDMEIYVEPNIMYYFKTIIEPQFWMNYKNYFDNEEKMQYKTFINVNFRRCIKTGNKNILVDFKGVKNMGMKVYNILFSGTLRVDQSFIIGIFDSNLKTHGYCRNYNDTEKGLTVHQGEYNHGEFVKPEYIGYLNNKGKYHGKGTLYTNNYRVRYTGIFNNGELVQGNKYENDFLAYRGFFKNLLYHGKGTEFFPDGTNQIGTFEFGVIV